MTHGIANMKRNETTTPPPVYPTTITVGETQDDENIIYVDAERVSLKDQDADIDLPDEEKQEPEFPCDDPSGIYVP